MRLKKSHQNFLSALLIVVVSLGLIELGLRLIDPWGLKYFDDVIKMGQEMFVVDEQRGYGLKEGVHQFSHWQAEIMDGVRITPDTNVDADCTVAFLGDSITFAHGVNNDQTWVNGVAAELSEIQVINYGVPRYNSTNALNTRRAYQDHPAYIYTIFNNDSEPGYDPSTDSSLIAGWGQPWTVLYLQLAMRRRAPPAPIDDTRFFSDLDNLLAEGRVNLLAFEDDILTDLVIERGYAVHVVPFPPHPVSLADFHLNPQGNAELAESLTPYVRSIAEEACT